MTPVARPLAGPGVPGTALNVLQQAGWTITGDGKANMYAFPADRRLLVAFLLEANDLATAPTLWLIRAYNDLHRVVWEATFTDDTPAEFIAAFLADLVNPEPLDPDRKDEEAPALAPSAIETPSA